MRVTQHSGRTHRNGQTYSTKHNDRNFASTAENIDAGKTKDNVEWTWCQEENPGLTFDEVEQIWYATHYQEQLDATNEKYIASRHKERVTTMKKWRKQKKHAPEEVITMIGKLEEKPDFEVFKKCFLEYIDHLNAWNKSHGNHMHLLNWALHQDEKGAAHAHTRRVWDFYNTKTHQLEVGQEMALTLAGVPLPHPDEPIGRYNNRKITFDAMMRDVWISIAKKNGLDIETAPLPKEEVGKPLDQYIREKEEKRNKAIKEAQEQKVQAEKQEKAAVQFRNALDQRSDYLSQKEQELDLRDENTKQMDADIKQWQEDLAVVNEFVDKPDYNTDEKILDDNDVSAIFNPEDLKEAVPSNITENKYAYASRVASGIWNFAKKQVAKFQKKFKNLKADLRTLRRANLEQRREAKQHLKEELQKQQVQHEKDTAHIRAEQERLKKELYGSCDIKSTKDGYKAEVFYGFKNLTDAFMSADKDTLREVYQIMKEKNLDTVQDFYLSEAEKEPQERFISRKFENIRKIDIEVERELERHRSRS